MTCSGQKLPDRVGDDEGGQPKEIPDQVGEDEGGRGRNDLGRSPIESGTRREDEGGAAGEDKYTKDLLNVDGEEVFVTFIKKHLGYLPRR